MRLKNGYTPKQWAYELAISHLKAVSKQWTGDIEELELTPKQQAEVKDAIATLHNQLLDKSGLDGTPL